MLPVGVLGNASKTQVFGTLKPERCWRQKLSSSSAETVMPVLTSMKAQGVSPRLTSAVLGYSMETTVGGFSHRNGNSTSLAVTGPPARWIVTVSPALADTEMRA